MGFIIVDENLKTSDPGIYAIGDVIGGDMLAHKATHEGRMAVEAMCGNPTSGSLPIIPAVVFTDPEIAWCGAAESQGTEVKVVKFPRFIFSGQDGLEMGTVYSALGSRVTLVEMTDGLLPGVDRDLVRILQARLRKDFESIHLNTKVDSLNDDGNSLKAVLTSENESRELSFDKALIAVGRKPNSGNQCLVKKDDAKKIFKYVMSKIRDKEKPREWEQLSRKRHK